MSHPPGYNNEPVNPDSRLLPPGWVQQYDPNYKTWFYVNTHEQPPRSSWVHPLGPLAPPPGPPPGASPNRDLTYGGGGWNQGPPPQQYNHGYGAPPPGGWNNNPPPHGGFSGYGYNGPPQGNYVGGYPPQEHRGWFGGGGHQSHPNTEVHHHAQPKKSGPGVGTALLAGGAGLVGGALLMDAIEDHDRDEYQEGYDQGYDQGFDNGGDF